MCFLGVTTTQTGYKPVSIHCFGCNLRPQGLDVWGKSLDTVITTSGIYGYSADGASREVLSRLFFYIATSCLTRLLIRRGSTIGISLDFL